MQKTNRKRVNIVNSATAQGGCVKLAKIYTRVCGSAADNFSGATKRAPVTVEPARGHISVTRIPRATPGVKPEDGRCHRQEDQAAQDRHKTEKLKDSRSHRGLTAGRF